MFFAISAQAKRSDGHSIKILPDNTLTVCIHLYFQKLQDIRKFTNYCSTACLYLFPPFHCFHHLSTIITRGYIHTGFSQPIADIYWFIITPGVTYVLTKEPRDSPSHMTCTQMQPCSRILDLTKIYLESLTKFLLFGPKLRPHL